jgi:hypothetical protein
VTPDSHVPAGALWEGYDRDLALARLEDRVRDCELAIRDLMFYPEQTAVLAKLAPVLRAHHAAIYANWVEESFARLAERLRAAKGEPEAPDARD